MWKRSCKSNALSAPFPIIYFYLCEKGHVSLMSCHPPLTPPPTLLFLWKGHVRLMPCEPPPHKFVVCVSMWLCEFVSVMVKSTLGFCLEWKMLAIQILFIMTPPSLPHIPSVCHVCILGGGGGGGRNTIFFFIIFLKRFLCVYFWSCKAQCAHPCQRGTLL